jgi:hypothetical protein
MKHTRHSSGLSLKMDFTPRPDGSAVIDVVHNGEYASAIVTHPMTVEAAREAYATRDIETYLAIFRMADEPLKAEARAA